jgi:hypothetical protein
MLVTAQLLLFSSALASESCAPLDYNNLQVQGAWIHDITNDSNYTITKPPNYWEPSAEDAKRIVEIWKYFDVKQICSLDVWPHQLAVFYRTANGTLPSSMLPPHLSGNAKCFKFDRAKLYVEWQTWGPFKYQYYLKDGENAPIRYGSKEDMELLRNKLIELGANWHCMEPPSLYHKYQTDFQYDTRASGGAGTTGLFEYWTGAPLSWSASSYENVPGGSPGPVTEMPSNPPSGPGGRRFPPSRPVPDRPVVPIDPDGGRSGSLDRSRSPRCEVGGETLIDPSDRTNGYLHYKGQVWFRALTALKGVNLELKGDYLCTCVNCPSGSSHATGLDPQGEFAVNETRSYQVDCVRNLNAILSLQKGHGAIEHFVQTQPSGAGVFRRERCKGEFLIKSVP